MSTVILATDWDIKKRATNLCAFFTACIIAVFNDNLFAILDRLNESLMIPMHSKSLYAQQNAKNNRFTKVPCDLTHHSDL